MIRNKLHQLLINDLNTVYGSILKKYMDRWTPDSEAYQKNLKDKEKQDMEKQSYPRAHVTPVISSKSIIYPQRDVNLYIHNSYITFSYINFS